jgi:CBS domain containing-hemolysin-like protein
MIPLALFLLGCAAIYVGTIQSAFATLMRLSLRLIAERDGHGGPLRRYLDDPMRLFVPANLLLGLAVVLATVLIARLVGTDSTHTLGIVVVLGLAFLVLCADVVPFLIVRRDPERVLDVLLPSFDVVARLLGPLTFALAGLIAPKRDRQPATGGDGEAIEENAAPEEEAAEPAGVIEGDQRRLLQSIVAFGDTFVREVMTPRPDIVAIPSGATLDELRQLLREQGYSRVPVFKENLDNILGFVFVKDLIQVVGDAGGASPISAFMRPAHFVPETKKVSDLLKEFQRRQLQIAIVVDEYGGTAGLVTIEDLLEELVGEIRDEYDKETEPVTDEGDGSFVFTGKADIDHITERLGFAIAREGFDTVGGYLLSRLGRVPAVGEAFEVDGLTVQVLDAERRRVNKVRMRRSPVIDEPEGGE